MAASMNVNIALLVTLTYVFVHFVDAEQCLVKGTTLTCTTARVTLEMKFKLCQHKPSVIAKIDVDEHDFHLQKEYSTEESVEADFTIHVREVSEAGAGPEGYRYIVKWDIGTVELSMKAGGHGKGEISVKGLVVYSGHVEESGCSGLKYWFNSQGLMTLKYLGAALLITTTAFCAFCYLAFCRRKRSKRTTEGGVALIPAQDNNEGDFPTFLPSREWVS